MNKQQAEKYQEILEYLKDPENFPSFWLDKKEHYATRHLEQIFGLKWELCAIYLNKLNEDLPNIYPEYYL